MMERDLAAEARAWRANAHDPYLLRAISVMDDEALTEAYLVWWQTYTRRIQTARSNRSGISSSDAVAAGEAATHAVRVRNGQRSRSVLEGET